MLTLQIIIGSTRPGRAADRVTPWLVERATAHGGFEVDVVDLRDWPLPMFTETFQTIGDRNDPTYSDPVVRAWNRKIKEADAYIMVTTEYNHSVPGVLKNAIDSVFVSYAFRNKPVAFVGYSNGLVGAARAIEHLAHIAIEAEAAPLRNTVLIGQVTTAFDEDHHPVNPVTENALQIMLDDLQWWGDALHEARAKGELPPGAFRRKA
ncbi:MAG TPA: NAD(P)H-dependent oxidoreductase [Ilumatobacteraceae bacterium]|jgi:NAD(P)H-dependent FMN reductase